MDLSATEHEAEELSEELPLGTENTFGDFSSTEDVHLPSEDFLSSIEDSSFSFPCMSSIRECEEYFETGSSNVKGSFVDFLSSYNHTAEHNSSIAYSDDSTKRHKTSTESQSFVADAENAAGDSLLCTEHGAVSAKEDADRCVESHLPGARNQRMEYECVQDGALSLVSLDECSFIDSNGLSKQQARYLQWGARHACACIKDREELSACTIRQSTDNEVFEEQENAKNVDPHLSIGAFCKMASHEPSEISRCSERPSWDGFQDSIPNQIDSGFVTGNNKKIFVDPSKITLVGEDASKDEERMQSVSPAMPDDCTRTMDVHERSARKIPVIDSKNRHTANSQSSSLNGAEETVSLNLCTAIRSKQMPIPSHRQSSHDDTDSRMVEIFHNVRNHFKDHEHAWVSEQFKWAWLHLFSAQMRENECLESEIIDIMTLKQKNEYSVLRRIVEFDDVPFKFMVLGIIRIEKDCVELYDGFYSLRFEIDKNIRTMLRTEQCDIGSRLYVFGSDILLERPTSIFDVEGSALRLHYNSIRVCNDVARLGAMKKASFLNGISRLIPDGGVVSAVVVKIKRIIELKYFVSVENYRNRVDDIEQEMEKIHEIARRADYAISPDDVAVRRFCKMVVGDESGECTLTWWSPPELRTGETYKLIYLTPVRNSTSLHLSTSRKTYFEKMG